MIPSPWGLLPAWPVYVFAAILGASLGSFANVLIYRLPAGLSLLRPPSRCPACERQIPPYENIPILSWLLLRGRCRGCGAKISVQYPLVEAAVMAIALFCVYRWGVSYAAFAHALLFTGLLALIVIDLRHWLLPFAITVPLAVVGLAGAVFFGMRPLADSLIGMAVGFGLFLILLFGGKWLLKRDAMGGGDVLFGLMAGSYLGWKGTLLMIFVASFLGTLLALFMMMLGQRVSGRSIPFGPFLAVAVVICLFAGDAVIQWYFRLLMR